jgi:hypothetical protein
VLGYWDFGIQDNLGTQEEIRPENDVESSGGKDGAGIQGRGLIPGQSRCRRCCSRASACSWARSWLRSRMSAGEVLGAIAGEGSDGFAQVRPGMGAVDEEVGRFAAPAGLHIAEVAVGHVATHEHVAVLDGAALAFMNRAGIAQPNILGPILLDREGDRTAAVLVEANPERCRLVVNPDHLAHEAVFDPKLPVSLGEEHAVMHVDVVTADRELVFAQLSRVEPLFLALAIRAVSY